MNLLGTTVDVNLLVVAIFLVMSLIAFVTYGVDKLKARRGKWRIPESTLLLLAFLGGATGALLGMVFFRHKTKHKKFVILVPLFFLLQLALLMYSLA